MFSEKVFIILLLFSLSMGIFSSCEEAVNHSGKRPLVGVDNEFLYKEDLAQMYMSVSPVADSITFVHEYIRGWLENALFYRMARRNVPDSREVERLVENYRKSLLLNIYQDKLITQQLVREIPEEDIREFYEDNGELFQLDEPMVQGLFLVLPNSAPKVSAVRKWLKDSDVEDVENIEKYSITNAITYDYFADSWRELDALAAKMPITADELFAKLNKDSYVELSDSSAIYFLSVSDMLNKGERMPMDMASDKIHGLLINSMKADFIKEVKRDLLRSALASGEVKFYDNDVNTLLADSLNGDE